MVLAPPAICQQWVSEGGVPIAITLPTDEAIDQELSTQIDQRPNITHYTDVVSQWRDWLPDATAAEVDDKAALDGLLRKLHADAGWQEQVNVLHGAPRSSWSP